MYIIASNTGNWDHDMYGAIDGAVTLEEAWERVHHHASQLRHELSEIERDETILDKEVIYNLYEDYEINMLVDGEEVGCRLVEEKDCWPNIFFIFEVRRD